MQEEKKIYIGNLDYGVTESDIAGVLEEKGLTAKEITIIEDKYTGRSKGFGFAEFETPEDAQKAIDDLNGQDFKGRNLKVSRAQKMRPRKERYGDGGGGGYSRGGRF